MSVVRLSFLVGKTLKTSLYNQMGYRCTISYVSAHPSNGLHVTVWWGIFCWECFTQRLSKTSCWSKLMKYLVQCLRCSSQIKTCFLLLRLKLKRWTEQCFQFRNHEFLFITKNVPNLNQSCLTFYHISFTVRQISSVLSTTPKQNVKVHVHLKEHVSAFPLLKCQTNDT